jgi:lipopolysaccharide transport system permease protein
MIIYTSDYRNNLGLFKTLIIMISNTIKSKDLIFQLFKRDFFAVYKKSFLGLGWIIISPILGVLSWVFMNATGVLNPGNVGIPYPAYVLISSSIWGLFMGLYTSAVGTLDTGSSFILQVNYPHEVLFLKQLFQQLVVFLISFLIIILVLLCFKVIPHWKILLLPFLILPMLFLSSSIGLIVSIYSTISKEFQKVIEIPMGLLIYITPIIYSDSQINPLLQNIIKYNPLTYIIAGVRDVIIYGDMKFWNFYFLIGIVSIILFIITLRLFYIMEEKTIERMI